MSVSRMSSHFEMISKMKWIEIKIDDFSINEYFFFPLVDAIVVCNECGGKNGIQIRKENQKKKSHKTFEVSSLKTATTEYMVKTRWSKAAI